MSDPQSGSLDICAELRKCPEMVAPAWLAPLARDAVVIPLAMQMLDSYLCTCLQGGTLGLLDTVRNMTGAQPNGQASALSICLICVSSSFVYAQKVSSMIAVSTSSGHNCQYVQLISWTYCFASQQGQLVCNAMQVILPSALLT